MSALSRSLDAKGARMRVEKAGIYEMTMAEYQADPAPAPSFSSGIAHRILTQSPLHAWHTHPRLNPNYEREESSTFDIGSCAHALLFEGEEAMTVVTAPDWRTKAAQEARHAARAANKIPVLARQMDECRAMALQARSAAAKLQDMTIDFAAGMSERVLIWQESNVWCRARPDWMKADRSVILDYKTTSGSAEPNAWIRNQMVPLGYDIQAIHYRRGNDVRNAQWVFLVQENYPPYACSFVSLSPAMIEIATRKWQHALKLWEHCLTNDSWKSYPRAIAYAEPTTWQMDQDEMLRLQSLEDKLDYLSV